MRLRGGIAVVALTGALIVGVLTVGCGQDPATFAVSGAWARPTPRTATNGVIYLTLTTDRADTLVGVAVPDEIADAAELHTSDASGGGSHQHGEVGGTVTMTPVEEVPLEEGASVEFRPGGNHIMLVDLARPLEAGDSFTATLRFSSGRTLAAPVTVSNNPPR